MQTMRKPLTLFLLCCIFCGAASAQTNIRMCAYQAYQTVEGSSEKEDISSICDLYQGTPTHASYEEAVAQIDAILDKVGLFRNFEVEECQGINNAIAVTVPLENGDLDRFILYDNLFFSKVSGSTGTDWGLASILAHEVGHHLNGHTLKSGGSNHRIELQADEFSGFVLARMGCSLEDAQAAVSKMLPDEASATHPAKADRLASIERGWQRGSGKTIKVEKIEEAVVKKIVENKVDEKEVKNLVTSEQVLSRYIDAIGGQEAIAGIKTLKKTCLSESEINGGNITTIMEQEFLTPINYLFKSATKMHINGKATEITNYTLILGDNFYHKMNENDKWESTLRKLNTKNPTKPDVSYIGEYAWLVNNIEISFEGVRSLNGKSYYVLELPEYSTEFTINNKETKSSSVMRNFYNIESGLLEISEVLSKTNGTKSSMKLYYSDYREVGGVLFPFVQKIENDSDKSEVNVELKFQSIEVNPTIDTSVFKVE